MMRKRTTTVRQIKSLAMAKLRIPLWIAGFRRYSMGQLD